MFHGNGRKHQTKRLLAQNLSIVSVEINDSNKLDQNKQTK